MIFKFEIGAEVYHKAYKKNMVVRARMEYQDFNSTGLYYDCFFTGSDGCTLLDQVPEYWLNEGHRIE